MSPEADIRIHVVHTTEVTRIHDAWNYLLDSGKAIAEAHGINPEELILSQYFLIVYPCLIFLMHLQ